MDFNIKEVFQPKILELFKKGNYNKEIFTQDLIAGTIVAIVALPLAIAFGIASGVTPQQGLITSVVAGFLISFFGGSNFLIGGSSGSFIIIIFGIVSELGMTGLIVATVLAGIMLIAMGVFKLGAIIKFIPYPIVVGFTSGIATTILCTQVKDFFGLQMDKVPTEFIPQWGAYFSHIHTINIFETLLSILCLLIIIYWPRITRKVPGSLIAILVGTIIALIMSSAFGVEIATIGSKFPELAGGVAIPKPQAPEITWDVIQKMFQPAITIALICAIESLISAMVADGVTGKKHNANTELIGQGIANIVTPFFGGMPATGAMARTMTSINNGGKTPITGIVHSLVLLLIFLFLMPYAVYIPLSCLAAILVIVSYNMSEWRTFKYLLKGDKADIAVLLITYFLTVIIDLTVAIEIGLVFAIILFVKRVSETSTITVLKEDDIASTENDELAQLQNIEHIEIPKGIEIFEIDGPFFFGLANKLDEIDRDLGKKDTKIRIIRMRKVPFMDSTGLNNLKNLYIRSKKEGVKMILSGVTDQVDMYLIKSGFADEIGRDFIFPHILPALKKAKRLLNESKT